MQPTTGIQLPDLERHLESQMRAQERQLVWVRLAIAVAAAAILLAVRGVGPGSLALLAVLAAVVVYDVVLALLIGRFPAREVGIVATALDLAAVTVAVYVAGEALDAYLFYVPIILGVALRYGLGASVWASVVTSFTYAAAIALGTPGEAMVRDLLPIRIAYLVGTGLAAGLFARGVIARATENAALRNQLEIEELERERARLGERLSALSREFGSSLERSETAAAIARGTASLLGELVALLVPETEGEGGEPRLRPEMVDGADAELVARWREHLDGHRPKVGEGIAGGAAATSTSILSGDADAPPPALPGDPDGVTALGLRSVLAIPMLTRGELRAVLVSASRSRVQDEQDRRLGEAIAERAGPALDNAALWADLREQMAREQRAQRVKDDFLSIVSHELRTPLTSIQGYSQLLEGRLRDDTTNAKELAQLQVIRTQVGRMRRLVEDLLDVSRIERRGVSVEPERLDLAAELRAVADRLRREHRQRDVRLEVPETLVVEADHDRIGQVLTNLADNAVKYSPEGGPVTLRAWRSDGHAQLAVADTGLGIPAELREQIFERFYQADDGAARRRPGGLGLGLYITRAIVQAHGGRVWVEPNGPAGRGSIFRVELPLVAPRSPTIVEAAPTGEPPPFVVRRRERTR